MLTRRAFVGLIGCVVASGGLGLGISSRRKIPLANMSSMNLKPLENTTVSLYGSAGQRFKAMVKEVQVETRRGRHGAPDTESVSVCLKIEGNEAPSGAYRLQGDELEMEELLFTSIGRQGRDRRLQAVINRIV